ncbi:MAG: mobilization protein [Gammaproteobacteria bacterium]|nr:mobilization protein [Gammaproteobacteria bacterium]
MPRKTPQQKIAELKQKQEAEKEKAKKKLDQIKAQIANENAKLAATARKQDTRRKVIAGALALKHMELDPAFADTMRKLLDEQIEREEDKKLFADI